LLADRVQSVLDDRHSRGVSIFSSLCSHLSSQMASFYSDPETRQEVQALEKVLKEEHRYDFLLGFSLSQFVLHRQVNTRFRAKYATREADRLKAFIALLESTLGY